MTPEELLRSGALRDAGLDALTHPDDPLVLVAATLAAARLGQPAEARQLARRARRISPEEPWVQLAWAEALLAEGEPFVARAHLMQTDRDVRRSVGARLLAALAHACRGAGHPEAGLAAVATAIDTASAVHGGRSLQVADLEQALAACAHALGRPEMARRHLHRALAIRRSQLPEHPDAAAGLLLLGAIERAAGNARAAERAHRESLAIWELQGRRSGPVGACRHGLAQALHRQGRFEEAREQMQQAVALARQHLGTQHVDTAISCFELGRMELDCGLVEEGLGRMSTARERVANKLGPAHPVVLAMDRWL